MLAIGRVIIRFHNPPLRLGRVRLRGDQTPAHKRERGSVAGFHEQ